MKRLSQAVEPVLRRQYDHGMTAGLSTPSCPRSKREMAEALEPRRLTQTSRAASLRSTKARWRLTPLFRSPLRRWAANPYSHDQTPFHVEYSGTLSLDAGGDFFFRLPNAESAILTIDGQRVI